MNYTLEDVKKFIFEFLAKEAECWTKLNLNNLDTFNQSVRELYEMAIEQVGKGLGISERTDFGIFKRTEKEIAENPLTNTPRHLYKLSSYQNKMYGNIWVAYVSSTNPRREINKSVFFEGFITGTIGNELKIIGKMIINTNRLTMAVTGWKGNVYNPSDLDVKKIGKFIETERYSEPGNRDNFSLNEYWKDK
ncbi:hypothetical protein [Chryseobacterium vaccae]|uniref:hypothetical protein n=1 Tax=Chryseobacterium vaccae TaxID=2604424 RepID=UPI001294B246|nr:hypothetical protein [Chryseobacterium vaccae]